jgi:hypothetical protein
VLLQWPTSRYLLDLTPPEYLPSITSQSEKKLAHFIRPAFVVDLYEMLLFAIDRSKVYRGPSAEETAARAGGVSAQR